MCWVRKAPTASAFQGRNTPANFTRHHCWQYPNLPVSLVLSALTSAPFSVAEGIQLVCWLFFSLTQRCFWSLTLSRFTTLSTSINCYTVLSILLGNSISLTFQYLSQFLSLFLPDWDSKKACFHFIFIPYGQLCLQTCFLLFNLAKVFFVLSEAPVLLGIQVPLLWLFCDIPQLCFISLFNHPPPCRGSC